MGGETKKIHSLNLSLALCLFSSTPLLAAEVNSKPQYTDSFLQEVEVIQDIDYGFFFESPKSSWGKDPFLKKPGYLGALQPEELFTLQGVVYGVDERDATAIINGEFLNVGDFIGGRQVDRIGKTFVVLGRDSSKIELDLKQTPDPDLDRAKNRLRSEDRKARRIANEDDDVEPIEDDESEE